MYDVRPEEKDALRGMMRDARRDRLKGTPILSIDVSAGGEPDGDEPAGVDPTEGSVGATDLSTSDMDLPVDTEPGADMPPIDEAGPEADPEISALHGTPAPDDMMRRLGVRRGR